MLYPLTSGPEATLVRQHENMGSGTRTEGVERLVHRVQQQQQEERASYEKLVSSRMEKGSDSDDYTVKLINFRGRLHKMGEKSLDERFRDILLQGLTDDYEFANMTGFHSPNFGINEI